MTRYGTEIKSIKCRWLWEDSERGDEKVSLILISWTILHAILPQQHHRWYWLNFPYFSNKWCTLVNKCRWISVLFISFAKMYSENQNILSSAFSQHQLLQLNEKVQRSGAISLKICVTTCNYRQLQLHDSTKIIFRRFGIHLNGSIILYA